MNANLNKAATQFIAYYGNQPVAFCAVLPQPHGRAKNLFRISRIVTMPNYQGVGIGNALIEYVAQYYIAKHKRFTITTTTPALMYSFQKNPNWHLKRQGRAMPTGSSSRIEMQKRSQGSSSTHRNTTSWEYINGMIKP